MAKSVILTGLRANNDLHIGNYLGALLPIVDMAKRKSDEYQVDLMVADLHSFTTPIDHSRLQTQIKQNLLAYAAAGLPLDIENIRIFRQSHVPAHSELTWILDCFTGMGEMSRMTQFKEKSKISKEVAWNSILEARKRLGERYWEVDPTDLINDLSNQKQATVGLFNYPVLMAADYLLYGASYVPVGDDQTQHLEFGRDVAERMNKRFGELFIIPEPVKKQHEFFGKDQGLRIKDLADPSRKMSKSADSDKGVIFLQDSPDEAKKKIMSATTDSLNQVKYDPDNQPGVSNLIEIYGLIKGKSTKEAEAEFTGQTQYGKFKETVAEAASEFLADFQSRLAAVDEDKLMKKLADSEEAMNKQANETLLRVQKAVGLR